MHSSVLVSCRRAVQSSLSALLSASLTSEANNLERIAVLEGGLSGVAQAASAAQTALADVASQGGHGSISYAQGHAKQQELKHGPGLQERAAGVAYVTALCTLAVHNDTPPVATVDDCPCLPAHYLL